jgi:aminopeptidase N
VTVDADPSSETVRLRFAETIAPGAAELHLRYTGKLNRELRGFYISEANGRKYAVTQLEATDARRMFPSFDEPDLKARFSITAIVDERDTAISNGAITSVTPGPLAGKKTIAFSETAPMSTYLVALAVGDFECTPASGGTLPLRVCATPGKLPLTAFARESGAASLQYMNDYFAIDYPFRKLDLVAIPDFAAGAMENTGAIFFRESLLLLEQGASEAVRKRAALVIAHEIAHQWFGNLVTMKWWDDLWLNEGFATWMEVKAVRAWKPDWHVEHDEIQSVQPAMGIDALPSTRAVRVMAQTPNEINELFDPIAYEKGAAILRMIEGYVGVEAFRGGVNAYIELHEYDNAAAEDFWTVMTRATRKPVDRIMQAFVTRPGVPILTVHAECRDQQTAVTLEQRRYLTAETSTTAMDRPWPLPVCLRYPGPGGNSDTTCGLLEQPRDTVTIDRCVPWVLANASGSGYFRSFYAPRAVIELARADALSSHERLALASDETALLIAGRRSAEDYLDLADVLAERADSADLLETVGGGLDYVREYFAGPSLQPALEAWVRERLGPIPSPEPGDVRFHAARLAVLGDVGRDPDVLRRARETVDQYLSAPSAADADPTLLNTFVGLAASVGDRGLYERYRARSEAATTPEERYRFLYALADFQQPDLLRRTFEYALSPQVRSQDASLLISQILDNPAGRRAVWPLLEHQWSRLENQFGAFGGISRIVDALGQFCDRESAQQIKRFFATHAAPGAERTLEQALDRIERCAAVSVAQANELSAALAANGSREPR